MDPGIIYLTCIGDIRSPQNWVEDLARDLVSTLATELTEQSNIEYSIASI